MWVTSAWNPNAPIDIYGLKTNGSIVTFSTTLSSIDTPMFLDGELDEFNDLVILVIDTPRDGDIAVMDNVKIGITQECLISESMSDKAMSEEEERMTKYPESIKN